MASQVITGDAVLSALLQAVVLLLLIRLLDVWEREPLWLVALFAVWGGIFAILIAGPLNDARLAALSPDIREVWGAAIVAPTDEEPAKGIALLVAFAISTIAARRRGYSEFDGPLDGMVYGAAIGIGFGFVEDLLYGAQYGLGVLNLRLGFLGLGLLGHAVYTASFGAGLGLATWSRSWRGKLGFPLLGLGIAMLLHAIHNGLVSFVLVTQFGLHATAAAVRDQPLPPDLLSRINSQGHQATTMLHVFDYGCVVVFFVVLVYWIRYQRRVLVQELGEEVGLGVIKPEERDVIVGYGTRLRAYAGLLQRAELRELLRRRRMHQRVTDLAFSKWRISRIDSSAGPTQRHLQRIAQLRRTLTPGAQASALTPEQVRLAAQRRHEARGSLIMGILGVALGMFGVGILICLGAIVLGWQARRDDPDNRIPAGFVLGVIGALLWGGVYAIAIAVRP